MSQNHLTQNNWLVIGKKENWVTAFNETTPLWGLKEERYFNQFQKLQIGDILWFYITAPVKGIIGLGHVVDKYIDKQTLIWPDEKKQNRVIWALRFRFKPLKIIPYNEWENKRIEISDFNLNWQIGFQIINEPYLSKLIKKAEYLIKGQNIYEGPTIVQSSNVIKEQPVQYLLSPHEDLQQKIAQIGKLQHFYTETEYPIYFQTEKKNIDVVWKRELNGVPTYAFEIELSGNLEKALDRLIFAYKHWNSKPRFVIPEELNNKVDNLLKTSDTDFRKYFKIINPNQIEELFKKKVDLREYEKKLGIYDIY